MVDFLQFRISPKKRSNTNLGVSFALRRYITPKNGIKRICLSTLQIRGKNSTVQTLFLICDSLSLTLKISNSRLLNFLPCLGEGNYIFSRTITPTILLLSFTTVLIIKIIIIHVEYYRVFKKY